jgi:hypothetical protein
MATGKESCFKQGAMATGIEIELARAVDGGLSSLRNERPSLTRNRPKNTKTRLNFGAKWIS